MFLLKIHASDKGGVAAVCDAELLGKAFETGDFCILVEEGFFGGKTATSLEISDAMRRCATANIVGNRIISELVCSGIIKESGIKEINGVKYAMIFRL